jgi:hypothetical protein
MPPLYISAFVQAKIYRQNLEFQNTVAGNGTSVSLLPHISETY